MRFRPDRRRLVECDPAISVHLGRRVALIPSPSGPRLDRMRREPAFARLCARNRVAVSEHGWEASPQGVTLKDAPGRSQD
jgi:hypothetical protein